MADEIRSTLEIALEKAEKIGKASKEELEWERHKEVILSYVGRYLKKEIEDLGTELDNYWRAFPKDIQKKLLRLTVETLLKNITLPREEYHLKESQRIFIALKDLLRTVPKVDQLFKEAEKLLKEYFHHKKALYQELVKKFSSGLSALEKVVSEQVGAKVRLSPEAHPQFQEEWNKLKEHLDREYGRQLDYIKTLLLKVLS